MDFVISFRLLTMAFPSDTVWADGCAEIIGYSAKRNIHIVISDGQCVSTDGTYVVHIYKPSNPDHKDVWLDKGNGYPWKYLSSEEKILEERVNFSRREDLLELSEKFNK